MHIPISRRHLLQIAALTSLLGRTSQLPVMSQTATPASAVGALAQGMATATAFFLAALDESQRTRATYTFEDTERTRWHWTTPDSFPRNGLAVRDMTEAQKRLAFALLQASVSPLGYEKAINIMALQKELGSDEQRFYVTVFGTPDADVWGWRWEGHHLSRHFTVVGDTVSMTPFFLGAWPHVTEAGLRAMPREEQAARELVQSLDDAQRVAAVFQVNTLTQHVTQNAIQVTPLDPVGIAYIDLTPSQQILVREIITTYLSVLADEVAAAVQERIDTAGYDTIRFGWAGEMQPRRPHYYRLQGSTFLLEFDCSRSGGTHIHSVWREFEQDFGAVMLTV